MFFELKSAIYKSGYKIKIGFEDGSTGTVDFTSYLNDENVFKAFLDINYFRKFRIEYGTLIWGDGEIDIAPETLYEKATGKQFSYDGAK